MQSEFTVGHHQNFDEKGIIRCGKLTFHDIRKKYLIDSPVLFNFEVSDFLSKRR